MTDTYEGFVYVKLVAKNIHKDDLEGIHEALSSRWNWDWQNERFAEVEDLELGGGAYIFPGLELELVAAVLAYEVWSTTVEEDPTHISINFLTGGESKDFDFEAKTHLAWLMSGDIQTSWNLEDEAKYWLEAKEENDGKREEREEGEEEEEQSSGSSDEHTRPTSQAGGGEVWPVTNGDGVFYPGTDPDESESAYEFDTTITPDEGGLDFGDHY